MRVSTCSQFVSHGPQSSIFLVFRGKEHFGVWALLHVLHGKYSFDVPSSLASLGQDGFERGTS